jgi:hypothetical protein
MARLVKTKIGLALIAILLGVWNYFLRDKATLPVLSELSMTTVWIIAGAILALTIILNFVIKD